jgi:AraC-like DNA-binding protein
LLRQSITQGTPVSIMRMAFKGDCLPISGPNERAEAFCVIIQLDDFKHHRLWKGDTLVYDGGYPRGTLAITDLRDEWRCQHLSPFDNVRFQIPASYMRQFSMDVGRPEFNFLRCPSGTIDTVVLGLAWALLPLLGNPKAAADLFLTQMILAMMTHISQNYGGLHFPARWKGTLAPWQEKRATEFLAEHVSSDCSVEDVAKACDLSRSYFIKAFKETFGKTPYRWLLEYRVARAKEMLASDTSLAEIATACGFADQSHMTRVFTQNTGESPGKWRRFTHRR